VKFDIFPSKLRKQTFFAENFKIQGGIGLPYPLLTTPMYMCFILFLVVWTKRGLRYVRKRCRS